MMNLAEINWNYLLNDGLVITLVGYLIVFMALVLLAFVFNAVPKLLDVQKRRNLRKRGKEATFIASTEDLSGEANAAIGTAIFMFFNEMHDDEDTIITIRKISKSYSPWSSKIYGITRGLNRRF
ncbi:MAG: OadG family transporter subunit [Cyclobacteriaceae bacterium]|jgi:Na+-transporting methylmalonyl-CoA/oxaloacetate decarboxylase gamma subunit